jgi:hypothetical protein
MIIIFEFVILIKLEKFMNRFKYNHLDLFFFRKNIKINHFYWVSVVVEEWFSFIL